MKTHTLDYQNLHQHIAITQCKSLTKFTLIQSVYYLTDWFFRIQQQTNSLVKTCIFAFFAGLALLLVYEEKPFQTKKF